MPITIPPIEVMPLLPQIIVAVAALVVLMLDVLVSRERAWILAALTLAALAASAAAVIYLWGATGTAYGGMFASDNLTLYFALVLLAGAALSVLLSWDYMRQEGLERGEFYALVLLALAGMMLLVASNDLLMVFLSLEALSLALYILVGFARERKASQEAALKYFLLGAFASAFLLYGIALFYGATGTTSLSAMATLADVQALSGNGLFLAGAAMVVVGFGFKLALVPFQMWTPDVYQGAPTPVTAFMSVATKAAAFAAVLRLVSYATPWFSTSWAPMLALLAVLTMTAGNLMALPQRNMKRMLAYSSIAQAGYILIGVVAGGVPGQTGVLFYLMVYTFMNIGAFAVVEVLERHEQGTEIGDYAGLAKRSPVLAAAMALFMFSLAGFPPTAGFFAKFYVFGSAVQAGYTGLAVIGVLNSLVGVVYYTNVVINMYMRDPGHTEMTLNLRPILALAVLIACAGTLLLGLAPAPLLNLAQQALALLP
jgi:NADH-quinone oxidoreductase subunit N